MNCNRCGKEIANDEYVCICHPCLMKRAGEIIEKEEQAAIYNEKKASGEIALTPKEAIIAMLNGKILRTAGGDSIEWSEERSGFIFNKINYYHLGSFNNLFRKPAKKTRPMTPFECLAWVNSNESVGYMVSNKINDYEDWCDWDIPQRFMYSDRVAYRRAKVLPDKSGIDESTIQGFVIEEEQP